MTEQHQKEVTKAYLAGYAEARERAQWNLNFAYAENERLRLELEKAWAELKNRPAHNPEPVPAPLDEP